MAVVIKTVAKRSLAYRAGIREKMTLVSINENPINDVLDYQFYVTEPQLKVVCLDEHGQEKIFSIRKDEYADIGLDFETYLMDQQHHCRNKCIFCFIDQLPPGMRKSLYFKDDDDRMSFFFGSYVTLTNISDEEIARIIKMHISPINVSVHTTNPELRVRMMKNKRAGETLKYLEQLAAHGIRLNTQLVLCPGINDGKELERSLNDLGKLMPQIESIAAVPVGLTDYRDGLEPLRLYTKEEAGEVIDTIERFAAKCYEKYGTRVAYASDEFYLKAGRPLPDYEYYGEFAQLDNGVGLVTSLRHDFLDCLETEEFEPKPFHAAIATGKLAVDLLRELAEAAMKKYPQVKLDVYAIENRFFGKHITVAGLVTGKDLIDQLREQGITAHTLLIPSVMLRYEKDKFLDDVTIEEVEQALDVKLIWCENDGYDVLTKMLGCDL